MGNCLYPVNPSVLMDENTSQIVFEGYNWSEFYDENESLSYDDNLEAAAPCHSCNLLDDSSLPFFIVASVLGILANGAVLFALIRPLFHWQLCPGRPFLVQLAVSSALFSILVPILAPGINSAHSTTMCQLGYGVWYGLAFAQALLIGCRACLGPKLGAHRVSGITLGLTVGLWLVAALLVLPITLPSDTSHRFCSSRGLGTWQSIHIAACFAIFIVLPLGLFGAMGLKKALGRGPGPGVDILWVWFMFWWPHAVFLGLDFLVRSRVFVLPTCLAQKVLDLLLNLAEALAILHCVATPLLLALFCHKATRTSLPSEPLPARCSSHLDTLGGKS
ncbi:PREDICTED: atypical chemokine receptor 1 [Galeopterus variegatus]|uniref:Atypical chemokine receptor 1 n=1 Tax=Galeopterus variegatus TaxID=482537 RepID=A0ABM0RYL9_GALVR|nr:PREDICTED: atypical chemokine receptor 1 [Galeopterus variegatus]